MNLSGNVVSSLQLAGGNAYTGTSDNQMQKILSQPDIKNSNNISSLNNLHAESSPTINKTTHGLEAADQANITFVIGDDSTLQKGDNRYEDQNSSEVRRRSLVINKPAKSANVQSMNNINNSESTVEAIKIAPHASGTFEMNQKFSS